MFARHCFRFAAVFLLTASVSLRAFDLTLKSGELLSGVSIVGISPHGVQLRQPGGDTMFVRYELLSPASLRTLSDFSPLSNAGIGGGTSDTGTGSGPLILPGMVGVIYFHSVRILQGGTLGWAESAMNGAAGAEPTQFGKVYINGLFIPQGNVWTGRVYPTPVRIRHLENSYPCWALSPSDARRITLSEE